MPDDEIPTRTSPSNRASAGDLLQAGTLVADRYRIVELAGRGGMGEVYRAEDLKLDQTVALKFLPEGACHDPSRLALLVNEVRVARQISHPSVCRVYDICEADGRHFLSMEWIEGQDLASVLRTKERLPRDRALLVAGQLCAGLAAAHDRGVLHRDLKPSNVMLDERGVARITDFGLAEFAAAIHGDKAREGTPLYMAPEQLAGNEVTARSDLYSLGLVLYEIFTGRQAYPGGRTLGEVTRQREDPLPAPSRLAPDIDPAVEEVLLRCLEIDPERRPPDALAIAEGLPGGEAFAAALAAAQQRADRITAYRAELAELRRAGLVQMSEAELSSVEQYHTNVLTDLTRRFDVDVSDRGKQLSLGMRVVSLLGSVALAASAFYFFYSIWGLFSVPLQIGILVTAPAVTLVLTGIVARREQGVYFSSMLALLTFVCLIVDTQQLEATFGLTPSVFSPLAWGLLALILAYGYRLRLLLAVGLLSVGFFLAGTFNHWAGGYWPFSLQRPENFFPAAILLLVAAVSAPARQHGGFAQIYRLVGLFVLLLPILMIAMNGRMSYLPFESESIEVAYQLIGFIASAGVIWLGIAKGYRESVYAGSLFFVILLFHRFVDWWWDWIPRYLFFLIIALTAVAVLLVLKRLRSAITATPRGAGS